MSLSDLLSVWSLAISIFGSLVTIVGFSVALAQIRKTRAAATAAKEAMEESAKRMRGNHLLVLLPQFHAVEIDLDYAVEGEDRRTARRALLAYSRVASQVAELMVPATDAQSQFVTELRESADLASQAKGKLASDARTTVRSAVAPVQSSISSIASRAAGLSTQFQLEVVSSK